MSTYTTVRTDFGTDVVDPEGEHVEEHMSAARAALLADALNVHEAAGLTPSQLQARVAELEAALRKAVDLAAEDDNVRAESELWEHLERVDI